MLVLSVISRLMDYPDEMLLEYESQLIDIVDQSALEPELKDQVAAFIRRRLEGDLLDWQSEYDGMFERGRSLGLWLFEHVHGESRDRGQAMVDLIAEYKAAGLEISQHELPDYIPLFLEFLSTQGDDNAKSWLLEVEHILGLLQCRLENRGSDYAVLFQSLLALAGSEVNLEETRQQVAGEKRDDTKQAIDKEWEDEEVTFGADSLEKSCDAAKRRPSEQQRRDTEIPVHWVGFETDKQQANERV